MGARPRRHCWTVGAGGFVSARLACCLQPHFSTSRPPWASRKTSGTARRLRCRHHLAHPPVPRSPTTPHSSLLTSHHHHNIPERILRFSQQQCSRPLLPTPRSHPVGDPLRQSRQVFNTVVSITETPTGSQYSRSGVDVGIGRQA